MTILPYKELVALLRTIGLTKGQVRALMPSWWDAAAATSPAGTWEFALMISRRLGLDAVSLAGGDVRPTGNASTLRFKHTVRISAKDLQPASRIAAALANAIVAAASPSPPVPKMSADQVKAAVLATGAHRVDFDALLAFAWSIGVPVIPLPNLPSGVKKMDAAALRVNNRQVIVISKRNDSKAWLSFILAHELGHVLLGHVPQSGAIVEGSLRDTATFDAESQMDRQEQQANAFANRVLGGVSADNVVGRWGPHATEMELVDSAISEAPALRTAPGQLILRYAFLNQRWKEAAIALRFLADDVDAQDALVSRLTERIDTARVGDDLQEFVERITGIAARAA